MKISTGGMVAAKIESNATKIVISNQPLVAFDIETGPLPGAELLRWYDPPDKPGEFDPAAVDIGRAKKKETIDAKIAEARREHEKKVADWPAYLEDHKSTWLAATKEKAALDWRTGRVLVIGYMWLNGDDPKPQRFENVDGSADLEANCLESFWRLYGKVADRGIRMVGHNILHFDLPFLVGRSWLNGVAVPPSAMRAAGNRVYFDQKTFVDTMPIWTFGQYGSYVGLNAIAKRLGLAGKLDDVSGANFYLFWFGDEVEHAKAVEYADQDVVATAEVATKLGIGWME